ncbi:MAG TPA: hypothetical protein VIH14_00605 [Anaerolineales bacterium]
MELGSILLFLSLLLLVALFVARPLFAVGDEEGELDSEPSHWLAERERVLDALAELDADWHLGKVPKDIYTAEREQLLAKGATALEEIEKAEKGKTSRSQRGKVEEKGNDVLEAMIATHKSKRKGHK